MKTIATLIALLAFVGEVEARKHPQHHRQPPHEPLSIRMLNPCALSYGYKSTDPKDPTNAFWTSVLAGIPAAAGDKDNRGNTVMKFSKWSDGVEACRRFQQGPLYGGLLVVEAIRRWDGGRTWKDYAVYIQRRTQLAIRRVTLGHLPVGDHRRLIQAQAEWESGRTQRGVMAEADLSAPPRP